MFQSLGLHVPTCAHTFDFNLTYCGARLIDGECKGTATEDEKCVLVLHTLDQLALKNSALGVLTTNNTFAFYKSWLEPATHMVKTEYDESWKFSLGPVYDISTGSWNECGTMEDTTHF